MSESDLQEIENKTVPEQNQAIRKRRWLKWILWGTVTFWGLIILIIIALPTIVSMPWATAFIEKQIEQSLNRSIDIQTLSWSWSNGIMIHNVIIQDDPLFSDQSLLNLKSFQIKPTLHGLFPPVFQCNLDLNSLSFQFIRDSNGKTNLDFLTSHSLKETNDQPSDDQINDSDKKDNATLLNNLFIPFDFQSRCSLKNISILMDDHFTHQKVQLDPIDIEWLIPSLLNDPVNLTITSGLLINDNPYQGYHNNDQTDQMPLFVKIYVDPGLDHLQRFPENVSAEIITRIPGVKLDAKGKLGKEGINGQVQIDLQQVKQFIEPIVSPDVLNQLNVSGIIHIVINAIYANHHVTIHHQTTGQGISFSNANVSIQPIDFSIHHQATMDQQFKEIDISHGIFKLMNNTQIRFQGNLKDLHTTDPDIHIQLNDMLLDTDEMVTSTGLFTKQQLRDLGINTPLPVVQINRFMGDLTISTGQSFLHMDGLTVLMPKFHYAQNDLSVIGKQAVLSVPDLKVEMVQFFPNRADLSCNINMNQLNLTGNSPVQINNINAQMNVSIHDMKLSSKAPFGVELIMNATQNLTLSELNAPPIATIHQLNQELVFRSIFSDTQALLAAIDSFDLSIPTLSMNYQNKKIELSPSIDLRIGDIQLNTLQPLNALLDRLHMRLATQNGVNLSLDGMFQSSPPKIVLSSTSQISLPKIPKPLLKPVALFINPQGQLDFTVNISTKKSIDTIVKQFSGKTIKTIDFQKDLSFIDQLKVTGKVSEIMLKIPIDAQQAFQISHVETTEPFVYSLTGQNGMGVFSGIIRLPHIQDHPTKILKKPAICQISFSGHHDGLRVLGLNQELTLAPFNLKETMHLTLSGVDRLQRKGFQVSPGQALTLLGGELWTTLDLINGTVLKLGKDELIVKGSLNTGAIIKFLPGKRIESQIWSKTPQMEIWVGDSFNLNELQLNLSLQKQYQVQKQDAMQPKDTLSTNIPLSVEVMQTERSGIQSNDTNFDALRQVFIERIRGRYNNKPTIAFRSLFVESQPLPFEMNHSNLSLTLRDGLPVIDYFSFDLLDGTIMGSAGIHQQNNQFFIQSDIAFSGINTAKFIRGNEIDYGKESEINGQITCFIPLAIQMSELFRKMAIDIKISHIGPKALERFLFALDPYGNNEAIVKQRQLLKIGSPSWFKLGIKNGMVSLSGEISVKGIPIPIPSIDRLNVMNIPGIEKLQLQLSKGQPVIQILKIMSASNLMIGQSGLIEFVK